MSEKLLKSSSNNRLNAMIDALYTANNQAFIYCKSPLSRMPEYYMAMHVANHFAGSFQNFGYRLEASVKETLADAGVDAEEIERLLKNDELRGNGRFDLVLRTGRRGVPAHVVEFKRGSRSAHLRDDLIRLAYVCETVKEGARMKTNYLVFTTRKSEQQLNAILDEVRQDAQLKGSTVQGGSVAYELMRYAEIGYWRKDDPERTSQFMAVAIFEVRFEKG